MINNCTKENPDLRPSIETLVRGLRDAGEDVLNDDYMESLRQGFIRELYEKHARELQQIHAIEKENEYLNIFYDTRFRSGYVNAAQIFNDQS